MMLVCAHCKAETEFPRKKGKMSYFLILARISNCIRTPLNIQNFTIPISKHMPNKEKLQYCHYSPQIRAALREENFHWNSNTVISLMTNSLNLNSSYLKIFYKTFNDSLYILEVQKSKFANI